MKTIFGPKKLLDDWVAALRSGKYKQGQGYLKLGYDEYSMQYCCLGILEFVADGKVEPIGQDEDQLPSCEWLLEHGIKFKNSDGDFCTSGDGKGYTPYLPKLEGDAAYCNDNGYTFLEIADAIEDCVEYTDE